MTNLTEQEFLAQYDPSIYERPSCTVDTILMSVIDKRLKILLIKRGQHPWLGKWALPGGFVNMNEDLDQAVWRELEEETNVSHINYFKQLYTLGKVNRDPRTRVISTVYMALIPEENIKNMHSGDDASDAQWFDIQKITTTMSDNQRVSRLILTNEQVGEKIVYEVIDTVTEMYIQKTSKLMDYSTSELAADHIKVINMAIDEIQNRVVTSGLIFSLLPKEFTLRQVREIYEIVTNKKMPASNFNKGIMKMLVGVDKKVYSYNKWAKLYRFNPMWQFLKEDL